MQDINPQGFSNPVLSAATSGDAEAARQNMINAFADAAQLLGFIFESAPKYDWNLISTLYQ